MSGKTRARPSPGWLLLAVALVAVVGGCMTPPDGPDHPVTVLKGGRQFDVSANARCSHIASLFRPDIERTADVNLAVVSGGYHYSERYVRVTEPLLLTINQLMLQDCILVELGEISPAEYSRRMETNASRYLAIIPPGGPDPATLAAAANDSIRAAVANDSIPSDAPTVGANAESIARTAAELRARIAQGGSFDEAELRRLAVDIAADRAIRPARNTDPIIIVQNFHVQDRGASETVPDQVGGPARERIAEARVLFDTGSAFVSTQQRDSLRGFVTQHCCGAIFSVYGFADLRGSETFNLMLSRLRATAVAALIRQARPNAVVREVALGEATAFGPDFSDNRSVHVIASRRE